MTMAKYRLYLTRFLASWFLKTGLLVGLLLTMAGTPVQALESDAASQQLYRQTLSAINKGHKTRTQQGLQALNEYPLYPYLVTAQLQRELRKLPYKKVDQVLSDYGTTVAAKQLRKKWLAMLASKRQWPQYIEYYQASLASTALRCWYMEALHQTGQPHIALGMTAEIWLKGASQPDACDPVFKRWQQAGLKTDQLVWERVQLALANNNTLLARYLSKRASAGLKPYTRRLISVHRQPHRLSKLNDFDDGSKLTTDIISYGLRRLAPRNIDLANNLWIKYRGFTAFSTSQNHAIRDKLARQIIASGRDDALQWLIANDPNADDDYLMEWRIRLALRQQQWHQAGQWISLLPESHRAKPRWRYWQARTWSLQSIKPEKTLQMLQQLASERHYYGFLAADILQQDYDFNHSALISGQSGSDVSLSPEITRARQFYQMGYFVPARREWAAATRSFDQSQLIDATHLAHQWGWHQQAIHTTIKADSWNDLSIRFPLAYQADMIVSAESATINPEWLYAITRQESAFAKDAYSPAGATGLMQLLPGTAKQVAERMGVSYTNRDLFSADKNIALGSNYLKQLLDDFSGNRILATAAYNAGPHRVKSWLNRQAAALPHDIWIETLPFYETRNYVQNVLAFSVIYGHRLGIDSPLINTEESSIGQP